MERDKALERMARLCSRSEHCRSDILSRLKVLGSDEAESIVDELCARGYIDDARYARAYARDKSSLQGWGSLKIKLDLQSKGIAPHFIEDALASMDEAAIDERLENMLRLKMKALSAEDPEVRFHKLARYALGRGFEYGRIKNIYGKIVSVCTCNSLNDR